MRSNKGLSVKNLSKSFDGMKAVDNVSFQVEQGEIVALLGESGAGKSTMMRCIAGLTIPDQGIIEVNGVSLFKEERGGLVIDKTTQMDYLSNIGLVFQHFNLFPHMTVLENIIEALVNVKKLDKMEAVSLADEWLDYLGMYDHRNKYPYQLSGGQKQRVAIVRAGVLKPKVLLFDEPTSALDPQTSDQVAELIRKLAKDNDMGILIITHDMPFAQRACDRVLKVSEGRFV